MKMIRFDEQTLRKAAAWQDFKEAQGLLNTGAVQESEETKDGWRGSVRVGKRVFRTTVVAKTATWLDARCPCPANQREGTFCPHAIATGLHLISPPIEKAAPNQADKPENPLPSLSWKIRLQGSWLRSMAKGHLAVTVSPDENRPPEPADDRLTSWLVSQKLTSKPKIQLALDPGTLPGFLEAIREHPGISSQDSHISVESGIQLKLTDSFPKDGEIQLLPTNQEAAIIGNRAWILEPETLSSTAQIPEPLTPALRNLVSTRTAKLPLETFLKHLDSLQSLLDFSSSEWFSSLQFIPASPRFELAIEGSSSRVIPKFEIFYPDQELPRLDGVNLITRNRAAERIANSTFQTSVGTNEITSSEGIQKLLTVTLKSLPKSWEITLSPPIKRLAYSYVFISPRIEIHESNDRSTKFDLRFESSDGSVISTSEIRRLLRSKGPSPQQLKGKTLILSDDIEGLLDPLFEDLDLLQENGRFIAKNASSEIINKICNNLHTSLISNDSHVLSNIEKTTDLPPIRATLRSYQIAGFRWLIDRLKRYQGALLADDMGLGKTIQTIALIEHLLTTYSQPKPAIIVMTTSLLGNWKAEFSRFAPNRKIVTLHGSRRDSLRETIKSGDVILTTYSTLARDLAYHLRQEYSVAVIDEASLIRNPDTDHSKAVARLKSANRIALTGTPVETQPATYGQFFGSSNPAGSARESSSKRDTSNRLNHPRHPAAPASY